MGSAAQNPNGCQPVLYSRSTLSPLNPASIPHHTTPYAPHRLPHTALPQPTCRRRPRPHRRRRQRQWVQHAWHARGARRPAPLRHSGPLAASSTLSAGASPSMFSRVGSDATWSDSVPADGRRGGRAVKAGRTGAPGGGDGVSWG